MEEQFFSLEALSRFRAKEEAERDRLPYKDFLENFKMLVEENHFKISEKILRPIPNEKNEFVCIKEPYEFIHLFHDCNGQDECITLFQKLLEERDVRVVEQTIENHNSEQGIWFNSTCKGINLRPGLKDEEWASPMPIVLGDDAVHAIVAGRTGSGKSVFLNSLIFSLMAEYAPWEIKIYLADFKKVELSRYLSRYEVPHIRAVAATSEIRYVVSLLSYLTQTMKARQDFFALIGQQKLNEVREKYSIVLPRVLFLVDEFQQLFLEATLKEQVVIGELLTSITKLGRATGYHLLFASQEMVGTMSSSVFANFKARFALGCDADTSAAVLGNAAASRINKKGIVLANTEGTKEEYNQLFKVPYISEDYFYEYLRKITEEGNTYHFRAVHKFYQEERIKNFSELEKLLEVIKSTREKYLHTNSSLVDVLTLGEAVVFNHKKYDYETVFLERGVKKNISVFSPVVDDTVYVCKLLATNFMSSPKASRYRHFILCRNDLFLKKYDLPADVKTSPENVHYSSDFLDDIIAHFERRKKTAKLLNEFSDYSSMEDFAYAAISFRVGEVIDLNEEILAGIKEISTCFTGKGVQDIPKIEKKILEDYGGIEPSYFKVMEYLYDKVTHNKTIPELFEPDIIWIVGAEMVGKFPPKIENVFSDAASYNMLFIFVGSNYEFNDFQKVKTNSDYIFVSVNNEKYYDTFKIPYTKKNANSIAIDFAISSSVTQRAFKKFKYELKEVIVPEIDFDSILE